MHAFALPGCFGHLQGTGALVLVDSGADPRDVPHRWLFWGAEEGRQASSNPASLAHLGAAACADPLKSRTESKML